MFWRRFCSTTWRFERLKGYIGRTLAANVKQMLMEKLRYRESGETLVFPKKKLKATWLKPPTPLMPRVFLSEIDIEAFEDERMSAIVRKAISSREGGKGKGAVLEDDFWEQKRDRFSLCENVSKDDYEYIAEKSEYAAWLLINGPEFVNHFALAMHRCRSEVARFIRRGDVEKNSREDCKDCETERRRGE